jgi:ankyrin repeat protein
MLGFPDINGNDRDEDGSTAAIAAVRCGSTYCIRLLLDDPRVDFDVVNVRGQYAVSVAAAKSSSDILHILEASGRVDMRRQLRDLEKKAKSRPS